MKTIQTEVLEIAYFDDGPADAKVLLLLHGWPESPVGFEQISAPFHAASFRTIAPFEQDALDLMDRLGIYRFSIIGHDWGAGTGYALAALEPHRINNLCAVAVAFQPHFAFHTPSYDQSRRFWYQFFMCSDRGMNRVVEDPIGFSRFQWETWSPTGWFTEDDFSVAALAWGNSDYPAITLNSYRSRWLDNELRDPRYTQIQSRLSQAERIDVPTLMIQGRSDFCDPPSESVGLDRYFANSYERIVIPGIGHFPHREAPAAIADAILCLLKDTTTEK